MAFKSLSEASWKDAAVIEVRSLIARIERMSEKADSQFRGEAQRSPAMENLLTEIRSVNRQCVRLADLIEQIDEKKRRSRRQS